MGEGEWFQTLAANLRVQDEESISYRFRRITKCLNAHFRGIDSEANSFYAGSYGRNTAIYGFSDLDMIYQLPVALFEQFNNQVNGPASLLQTVRASIKNTYPSTDIGADGQVVVVGPFNDGLKFEVVPAWLMTDGTYRFPNSNAGGSWGTTDPKPEISAMKTRNDATNANLVHLCRMMRPWKGAWAVTIGGLLIDTLAYQFIENWGYRDKSFLYHDNMARDFFEFAMNQAKDQTFWRAPGSGQYVYGGGFQYKAKRCHNLSVEAIAHNSRGEQWAAKHKWRSIFGTAFPE